MTTTFYINIFLKFIIALTGILFLISGWILASSSPIIAASDLVLGVVIMSFFLMTEVVNWQRKKL